MIVHVLIAIVAGWIQRHQQQVIPYLLAENRVRKAHLGGRRLRLTDTERRRLAALAYPLGRKRLKAFATLDGHRSPEVKQDIANLRHFHWVASADYSTLRGVS